MSRRRASYFFIVPIVVLTLLTLFVARPQFSRAYGETIPTASAQLYLPAIRIDPTSTYTVTPTPTPTPTLTPTPTSTFTSTPTPTPTPTATSTPIPTPTNTPLPSGVYALPSAYRASGTDDDFILWGEVFNNTDQIIDDIQVNVSIYGISSNFIGSGSDWLWNIVLDPRNTTCFKVTETDLPEQWYSYGVDSVTYDAFNGTLHAALAIISDTGYEVSSGRYEVTGQLQNTSDMTITSGRVIVTLYDNSSRVIGCEWAFFDKSDLGPNEITAFEVEFSNVPDTVGNYRIQVAGRLRRSVKSRVYLE